MEYVIEKGEFEQKQLTEEELPPSRTHWGPDAASPPRATDTCKGCFGETLHIGKSQIAPENQEYSWPAGALGNSGSGRAKPADCVWKIGKELLFGKYARGAVMHCLTVTRSVLFSVLLFFSTLGAVCGLGYYGYTMYILYRPPKRKSGIRQRCEACVKMKIKPDPTAEEVHPDPSQCPCCGAVIGLPTKTTAYKGPDYSNDFF
jgi:hypothetical protein